MAVFYRKYRPQKLGELVGQDHVKESLSRALTSGKIAHAYLFAGPKGLGKTTTARILAKAVNCYVYRKPETVDQKNYGKRITESRRRQSGYGASATDLPKFGEPCDKCDSCLAVIEGRHLDLMEIDAASNRGIDDIRDLREKIRLAPATSVFKVYIVDEVHSLTPDAFNALLKTLEEPPPHAIFILCTTEASKLPPTIISRCTRFDFLKATIDQLVESLTQVVKQENLEVDEQVFKRIAQFSDGSYRDGLSILDQLAAGRGKIDQAALDELLLSSKESEIFDLLRFLKERNKKDAIILVNQKAKRGDDLKAYLAQVIEVLRIMLLSLAGVGDEMIAELGSERQSMISQLVEGWQEEEIINTVRIFQQAGLEIKSAVLPQLPIELAIVELLQGEGEVPLEAGRGKRTDEPKWTKESKRPKETKESKKSKEPGAPKANEEDFVNERTGNPVRKTPSLPVGKRVDEIVKIWPQVLANAKKQNFSVEALLRSARPFDFDGEELTLEVFYLFHKERLEDPKTGGIVVSAISQVLGRKVILKCVLGERAAGEVSKPSADGATEDLAQAIAEIFTN